jgi:hypothetical protein
MTFLIHRLVQWTILSNTPPHHGAFGTLIIHFTVLTDLAAALKILALSESILRGRPLLAMKQQEGGGGHVGDEVNGRLHA